MALLEWSHALALDLPLMDDTHHEFVELLATVETAPDTTLLAAWFPQHAQSMDAALALHLRRVGFDPVSGTVHAPGALPAELIHGCGGHSCHEAEAATA